MSLFSLSGIALLAAMLLTEAARAADSVSYGRITSATYTVTDTLEGYLFRDERVLTSKNPGVISYTVPSHASVTENTVLAHVYNDDTGTNERATASALYARIEECRAALAEREDLKYVTDVAPECAQELCECFGKRFFATPKKMGAETAEANINAGLAAARQIVDYFTTGNTRFQVNK